MLIVLEVLLGVLAGTVTGLIGGSGVMVIVPGLTLLGQTVHRAIAASLAVDVLASLVVSWTYYQAGNIRLRQGLWMALASVVGAQLGSHLSVSVPEVGLGTGFGFFLLASAVIFWRRGARQQEVAATREHASALARHPILSSVGLGLAIGVISGLLGAGGGVMILMVLIFALRYPMHAAVGTSTLIMAMTAASGAFGHALNGNLPYLEVFWVGLGTILAGRLASLYANRVSEAQLGKVVGALFAALGVVMLVTNGGS